MLNFLTAPTPSNGSVHRTEKEVFKVMQTFDYDKFKIMGDNRDLNDLHVYRLQESFKKKHLICPIIVNERMQVIDGQHRLAAARKTAMPIYYIVVPGYGIEEVSILNTNQKNWSKQDYLKMYCERGVNAYLLLAKFMQDFPDFGIQAAERIVAFKFGVGSNSKIENNGIKMTQKAFEEGNLKVPNIDRSYILANKILEFKPFYENFHRGTFVSAVAPLIINKKNQYNHKEMIYKLSVAPKKLEDADKIEAYRMILEDIYNWKRSKENKVSFRYA